MVARRNADGRVSFYTGVGPTLSWHDVSIGIGTVVYRGDVTCDEKLQYAWPHPSLTILYTVTSDGGPGRRGTRNALSAWEADPATGGLTPLGAPAELPYRPLHVSTDPGGRFLLVAYNDPSAVTVHEIAEDGSVGRPVPQPEGLDVGIFAHQVLVTPDGARVVVPTRGNYPYPDKGIAEDPGALLVYDLGPDGVLAPRAKVAPNGGYGFGPRHVAFHPSAPWLLVSVERQSQLHLFRWTDGELEPEPAFVESTLEEPDASRDRQHGGAIQVHPSGRTVYVTNRSDETVEVDGEAVFEGGENSVAVFGLDPETGAPRRLQVAPTRGLVPRTLSLHPNGRMLVAANQQEMRVREDGEIKTVPASLAVFRISADGTLRPVDLLPIDTHGALLFWSGFVAW